MQNARPRFKYRFISVSNKRVPCIETGGKVIHEIGNLDEFYGLFGYSRDIGKSGLLPDEFIWTEYINQSDGDFSDCAQMHIIEYLKKHSAAFLKEYGDKCESWIAAHAEAKRKKNAICVACRIRACKNKP